MKRATGHRSNDIRIQKCRESINYLQKSTQTFFLLFFISRTESAERKREQKNLFFVCLIFLLFMYERSFLSFSGFLSFMLIIFFILNLITILLRMKEKKRRDGFVIRFFFCCFICRLFDQQI